MKEDITIYEKTFEDLEIDDIVKPLAPQTVVSIGKKDCEYISIITFTGLNLLIEAESGQIVDKKITK